MASASFGWLSFTAITKSPPPATMSRAMSFWHPMASIVISGLGEFDLLQQEGDGRDLVGLLLGRHLAQGDPVLARPGADDVQRTQPVGRVVGPPARLAVDGDQAGRAALVGLQGVGDPVPEAPLKRLGLEGDEHPADAIP